MFKNKKKLHKVNLSGLTASTMETYKTKHTKDDI